MNKIFGLIGSIIGFFLIAVLALFFVVGGGFGKVKAAVNQTTARAEVAKESSSLTEFLSDHTFTNSTREAGLAYQKCLGAQDALAASGPDNMNILECIFKYGTINKTNAYNKKSDRAAADTALAKSAFNASVADDELYAAEKSDANQESSNQNKSKRLDVGVIIIIVVVILLIVLFIFLNKRSTKPKRKAVPVSPAPDYALSDRQATNFKANKMNACRKMASKVGVDADTELKKYNGDVDALYMALVRMQPLEDD